MSVKGRKGPKVAVKQGEETWRRQMLSMVTGSNKAEKEDNVHWVVRCAAHHQRLRLGREGRALQKFEYKCGVLLYSGVLSSLEKGPVEKNI